MHDVYLGLGSNLGNRKKNLEAARLAIHQKTGRVLACSSMIETQAWGKENAPDYLNLVLLINTEIYPLALIQKILEIEKDLGRVRKEKWGDRLIDIDLLYFNDWHFSSPSLQIPHPHLTKRRFVLEPLAEIAPNFHHPILNKSNISLLEELK